MATYGRRVGGGGGGLDPVDAAKLATVPTGVGILGVDAWLTSAISDAAAIGCTEWGYGAPAVNNSAGTTSFIDNVIEGGGLNRTTNGTFYFPSQTIFQNPKTSTKWLFKARFRQAAAATAGQGAYPVSLLTVSGQGPALVDDPANTPTAGNWYCIIHNGLGGGTKVDTTIPVDTNWHDLQISPSGSNVLFKLDGVLRATIANTDMPTTAVCGALLVFNVSIKQRKVFWAFDGSAV